MERNYSLVCGSKNHHESYIQIVHTWSVGLSGCLFSLPSWQPRYDECVCVLFCFKVMEIEILECQIELKIIE